MGKVKDNQELLKERRQFEIVQQLAELCEELGWRIAIPGGEDDEIANGLVIGNIGFLHGVLTGSAFEDGSSFQIWTFEDEDTDSISEELKQLDFDAGLMATDDDTGKVH